MSYALSPQQLQSVLALAADKRYDYCIDKINAHGQIWSLRSDKGLVLLSSDGEECLPIWPHADFAQLWATGDWADCQPFAIDVEAWRERWLPGLEADGLALAVFPNADEEGIVVLPDEMAESLRQAQ